MNRLDSIREVLRRGIARRAFPGAAVAIGDQDRIEVICEGRHAYDPGDPDAGGTPAELIPSPGTGEGQGGGADLQFRGDPDAGGTPAVQIQTLYDLASLTKILATTQAAMTMEIDPETPVSHCLHEWQTGGKAVISIRQLLDHTAGLPAFRRYEEQTLDSDAAARLILAEPLEAEPGTRTVYSDLGPILVGMILERIEPGALRRYGEGHGLTFNPSADQFELCPPAEPVEHWRARMWDERGLVTRPSVKVDGVECVRGEVHDPRAALLGGVAGHAGLFGTVEGVAKRLQDWLRSFQAGDPILRKWTEPSSPGRGLGFDLDPGAEVHLSHGAFGHYGFTGTMAWVEPARDRFIVMLSNRIHPTASNLGHRAVRAELIASLDA